MNRFNWTGLIKGIQKKTIKYTPEILTGFGVAGMFTATIMGIMATPKALRLIEDEEIALRKYEKRDITNKDRIRVAAKCYIPTVATLVASSACVIGASRVNYKRNAALAAAYSLSETAFKEYRSKVVETVGQNKEREVRDGLAKDYVEKKKFNGSEEYNIIDTGDGDVLFIDSISGQPFRSSVDAIRQAEGRLLKNMINNDYVSLNDLYYELGLNQTSKFDDLGWHISTNGSIDLDFGSTIFNNKPCMVLQYRVEPKAGYDSFS